LYTRNLLGIVIPNYYPIISEIKCYNSAAAAGFSSPLQANKRPGSGCTASIAAYN
jgi:hypothetical protein